MPPVTRYSVSHSHFSPNKYSRQLLPTLSSVSTLAIPLVMLALSSMLSILYISTPFPLFLVTSHSIKYRLDRIMQSSTYVSTCLSILLATSAIRRNSSLPVHIIGKFQL